MFTGIVLGQGTITALDDTADRVVTITTDLPLDALAIGGSMACSGVCLTAIKKTDKSFTAQLSAETLAKTTARHWKLGDKVNLEPPMRLGDEIGGHMVLGHVDGVAELVEIRPEGESVRLFFDFPSEFAPFLAPKGSLALDGVSLTLNGAEGRRADVALIPHTQAVTSLGALSVGQFVNFEVDMMARYLDRLLKARGIV